ncbi:MAG: segregation/condensation protein A [Archangiaceae bacterium]|nr:segregation/condensation protein A [Archangiaceae bacterium]
MKEAPVEENFESVIAPRDAFKLTLPNFEGPLDLLLHLIREHKVDILDIPIALITEKYLGHITRMKEINLDIAGEFLVMAATLLQLKSRMLLPQEKQAEAQGAEAEESQPDPRAELVRRLLEYQKYKEAAASLQGNDLLDRDVFPRRVRMDRLPLDAEEVGFQEISVFKLIEALDRVLKKLEPKFQHEVVRDRLSLSDAIHKLADKLRSGERVSFTALFEGSRTRSQVILTFLAVLEMCKLRLIRVFQSEDLEELFVAARGEALKALGEKPPEDVRDDYQ